jgi:hypothetical protein
MPLGGLYDFEGGLGRIHDACREVGRDPDSVHLGMFFAAPPQSDDVIAPLADKGVKRVILPLPPAGADTVLPILDKFARYI